MNTAERILRAASAGAIAFAAVFLPAAKAAEYDLVVYGGTSGGVMAAVQGARMGKTVALVEPGRRLGGLSSGGLGQTDKGKAETIGGLARAFYERVGTHYGTEIGWTFEPHVAEAVFDAFVDEEERIAVYRGERLDLEGGVKKRGGRIVSLCMESGMVFGGRMFIDATYEGDLMALAGVSYHVGRESRAKYGEKLAGVLEIGSTEYRQPKQFFPEGVDPYVVPGDASSGFVAGIQDVSLGEVGAGDAKIQAYNFRVCLTTDPANRVSLVEPERYDPGRYELLARYIAAFGPEKLQLAGRGPGGMGLLKIDPMPSGKTDINDGCPFSTDYIGANWDYPEGDYATRERIVREHADFTKGLLWFLASDSRVPVGVREEMRGYGYPADEYVDNGHFSHQLYIREARRMIGRYVMRQQDCQEETEKPHSIGIGSYGVDSHHLQRVVLPDGRIVNEGNFLARHHAYEIPYESLTPVRGECENLLVPVCVSSSHIAFGSIRMEPVFMILGQSAATAAALALDADVAVQEVPYGDLRRQLLADGQVLSLKDLPEGLVAGAIAKKTLAGIVIDDTEAVFTGDWKENRSTKPFLHLGYRHDLNEGKGEKSARFEVRVPKTGRYEVRLAYNALKNRATNVPVTIEHAGGREVITVDQRKAPPIGKLFFSLGRFAFEDGKAGIVVVGTEGTDGHVIVDGVQFVPVD